MNKAFLLMCSCPDHPKIIKLMLQAGDRAYWSLTKLWAKVAQERPSGRLRTNDPDYLEIWGGWTGDRGLFAHALLELKLIDEVDGEFVVHDWTEHNEYTSRAEERRNSARRAAEARWKPDEKGNDSKGGMRPASQGQCLLNSINKKENTLSEPSPGLRLGKLLFELIQTRDPKAQPPNMERWAVEIERIMRLDGRTAEEVEAVIRWAHADSFWAGVILSPRGLRDKFTQLLLKMGGPVVPASGDGGLSREEWRARKEKEKAQPGNPQAQPKKGKQAPP